MYKEEKIADGIYITKFNKEGNNTHGITGNNTTQHKQNYVYTTTSELIKILEGEFEEILAEIELLYNANEEMLEFDPNDYDLIQARDDNLVIITKRIEKLKEIQNQLRGICPTNPIVNMDVYDKFLAKKDNVKEDIITEIDL
jgi:hypothetical protein